MEITINLLSDCPEYIPTVVDWLYCEWGNNNPLYWESWVRSSSQGRSFPATYVLFVDNSIAGTFSLWRCDLQSCQHLFPWFGGLYLQPQYRGIVYNGVKISYYMQNFAFDALSRLGFNEVFLFTEKESSYYESNGWERIGTSLDEKDKLVYLYRHVLFD